MSARSPRVLISNYPRFFWLALLLVASEPALFRPAAAADPADLDAEFAAYQRERAAYDSGLTEFRQQEKAHAADRAGFNADRGSLADRQAALAAEIEAHNAALAAFETDLEAHNGRLRQHRSDQDLYAADVGFLSNDSETYRDDLARWNAEFDRYDGSAAGYRDRFATYVADSADYRNASAKYTDERQAYESGVAYFNSLPPEDWTQFQYDRLVRWLAELNRRHAQLNEIHAGLTAREQQLTNDQSGLETKRRELLATQTRLTERHTDLETRRTALETRRQTLETSGAGLNGRAEELQQRQTELDRRKPELDSRADDLQSQVAELKRRGAELDRRRDALDDRRDRLDDQNTELHRRLDDLERRLSEAEQASVQSPQATFARAAWRRRFHPRGSPVRFAAFNFDDDLDAREAEFRRRRESLKSHKPQPKTLQLGGRWAETDAATLKGVVQTARQPALARWLTEQLHYERRAGGISPVTCISHSPPTVAIYDGFFELSPERRQSILGFEAGKAFYVALIDQRRDDGGKLYSSGWRGFSDTLTPAQQGIFDLMNRGIAGGEADLRSASVGDFDDASRFGYAYRVALFQLPPPDDVDAEAWREVSDLLSKNYLAGVLKQK